MRMCVDRVAIVTGAAGAGVGRSTALTLAREEAKVVVNYRSSKAIEQCDHGQAWQNRKKLSPQDTAEGIVFLCSDAGRFVSSCELPYMD